MYNLPTEPMSIGRVIDNGIKLFTSSIKKTYQPWMGQ